MRMWLKLAWAFFALAALSLFFFTLFLAFYSACLGAGFLVVHFIAKKQRVKVRDTLRWKPGYYSLEEVGRMTGYRKEDCRIILADCVRMRWVVSFKHPDFAETLYRYRFPSEKI